MSQKWLIPLLVTLPGILSDSQAQQVPETSYVYANHALEQPLLFNEAVGRFLEERAFGL